MTLPFFLCQRRRPMILQMSGGRYRTILTSNEANRKTNIRECWCATQLFSLSSKVADSDCELACDGDKSQICGGDLRISVCLMCNPHCESLGSVSMLTRETGLRSKWCRQFCCCCWSVSWTCARAGVGGCRRCDCSFAVVRYVFGRWVR